jgi:protein arginine N-methyltransferase 1
MTALGPDTILQRAPNLEIHLDASDGLQIEVEGRVVDCAAHALRVLDAFAGPTSLQIASDRLGACSAEQRVQLADTVVQLYEANILRDTADGGAIRIPTAHGFGAPLQHVAMLNDRTRTASFLSAIREVVRAGDVVVDIGTGTGILAVAAARAGASRVYAIERTTIADVAAGVFATSGVGERITLVRGGSSEIELPEPADVLVSETIGNDPLNERLIEIARDARSRFLKPQACFLPERLTVLGLPLTIPSEQLNRRTPTADVLERWRKWYDLDFSPLAEVAAQSRYCTFQIASQNVIDWPVVGDPVVLAELDVATAETSEVLDRLVEGRATATGVLNGLLVYFEAKLGSTLLSTHPRRASTHNSWDSPVWCFHGALHVRPGDRFQLRYQFGRPGDLSQVTLVA